MELTRLLKFHCNQCGQKREYKEGQAQLCQKFPKGATSVYTLKVMLYKIAQNEAKYFGYIYRENTLARTF